MRIFGLVVLWLLSLGAIGLAAYGAWESPTVNPEYIGFTYALFGAIFVLGLTLNPAASRWLFRTPGWRIAAVVVAALVVTGTVAEGVNYGRWLEARQSANYTSAMIGNIYIRDFGPNMGAQSLMSIKVSKITGGLGGRELTPYEADHIMDFDRRITTAYYHSTTALEFASKALQNEPDIGNLLVIPIGISASRLKSGKVSTEDAVLTYLDGGTIVIRGEHMALTLPLCRKDILYAGTDDAAEAAAGVHPVIISGSSAPHTCGGDPSPADQQKAARELLQALRVEKSVTLQVYAHDGTLVVSALIPTDRLAEAEAGHREMNVEVDHNLNAPFSPFTYYPPIRHVLH